MATRGGIFRPRWWQPPPVQDTRLAALSAKPVALGSLAVTQSSNTIVAAAITNTKGVVSKAQADHTSSAAVINTITKDFPLNVMYWAVREDGNFEVIDGQQRTISICQYVDGDFAFNNRYFHNLKSDEQEQLLNYKLMVYLCSGTDSEKLEWFRTINIAGEKLTEQELRNARVS